MSGVADETRVAARFMGRRGWADADGAWEARWAARLERFAPGAAGESILASLREQRGRRRGER